MTEDSDLVLPDPTVSRDHAHIEWENGDPIFFDDTHRQRSTVNDQPVERHPLADGDVIRIGPYTLTFRTRPARASQPTMARTETLLAFSPVGLPLLDRLAAQAAQNKLDPDERRLWQLPETLAADPAPAAASKTLLREALTLIPADRGQVVFPGESESLVVIAAAPEDDEDASEPVSASVIRQVLATGQALACLDVSQDRRFRASVSLAGRGASSVVAAPLVVAGGRSAVSLSYGATGNLAHDPTAVGGGERYYSYDEEHRLVYAETSSSGTYYLNIVYDALGRRVNTNHNYPAASGMILHVYSGLNTIEEYEFDGHDFALVREFVWGAGFPEPVAMTCDTGHSSPEVLHYLHGPLGSTAGLADADGAVVERYAYDPYGKTFIYDAGGTLLSQSAFGNPFAFTGQRYDAATGLYHFYARIFPGLNLARFDFTYMHSWFTKEANGRINHQMIYHGRYYNIYMSGYSEPTGIRYEVGIDFLADFNSKYWADSGQGRIPLFVKTGRILPNGSLVDEEVNYLPPQRILDVLLVKNNPVITAYHAVRKRVRAEK